jgi:hypothetical protein
MQDFITVARTVMPFVVTFFISYLIGSFVSVSWDPQTWDLNTRIFMTTFGVMFGVALWLRIQAEDR